MKICGNPLYPRHPCSINSGFGAIVPPIPQNPTWSGFTLPVLHCGGEQRYHYLVVAGEAITAPRAVSHRSSHDVGQRPVVLNEIEIDGREIPELMAQISHYCHCF